MNYEGKIFVSLVENHGFQDTDVWEKVKCTIFKLLQNLIQMSMRNFMTLRRRKKKRKKKKSARMAL